MRAPSPGPARKLSVRVRRAGPDVEFRVDDCGPGIRPDNLERIFERFYTDRPEGSFGSNSGLGLSISKQIVDAHRGRIWAENRYGKAGRRTARSRCSARASSSAFRRRTMHEEALIHGTCLAIGGTGVLLLGAARLRQVRPGAAPDRRVGHRPLRQYPRSARLVADDQVAVRKAGTALMASAPAALAGKLEIRGLGIVELPAQAEAALRLAVRLTPAAEIERLPDLARARMDILGIAIPLVLIDPESASAPARIRAALDHFATG